MVKIDKGLEERQSIRSHKSPTIYQLNVVVHPAVLLPGGIGTHNAAIASSGAR